MMGIPWNYHWSIQGVLRKMKIKMTLVFIIRKRQLDYIRGKESGTDGVNINRSYGKQDRQ